jgi:hypothetical protein
MAFRPRSRPHHLPRRQERDGGGFYVFSTPFALLPPPSHATVRRGGSMWPFDSVHAATSSLVCTSETEVGFHVILTLFALPPPSHARARRRWIFRGFDLVHAASTSLACQSETVVVCMEFQPCLRRHHLPRMQPRDGGGFYVVSTPFTSPQRVRCGLSWPFDPVRTAPTPCMQQRVGDGLYGLSTPFALPPPPSHATASRSLSGS